jgi:hypothetical protein
MYVHALHTVHALPDLRVVAGRLRDGVSVLITDEPPTLVRRKPASANPHLCYEPPALDLMKQR